MDVPLSTCTGTRSRCTSRWQVHRFQRLRCGKFLTRGMQHVAVAGDTENVQAKRPQLGADAPHMPDESAPGIAVQGTQEEALLQDCKRKMTLTVVEQT